MKKILTGQGFTLGLIIALLLGYWFPEQGLPGGALRTELTTPVAIITIFFLQGLNLSGVALRRGLTSWGVQLFAHGFGFVFLPLATWFCVQQGWVSRELAPGLLFLSILPTTISTSVVYSDASGGDTAASTFCAAMSNLLGIFVVPVFSTWVIFPLLNEGVGEAIETELYSYFLGRMLWLIAVPMLVGLVARAFLAPWVEGRKVCVRNICFACVLFIAYAGFCKGFRNGAALVGDFFWEASLWVIAFLIFANCSSALFLKLSRFSWPQSLTVFFAATQKSLAVGLPMGYLLFGQDNPQLFAILLPLILFHPLQLLLGAALCSLLPKNSERSNS